MTDQEALEICSGFAKQNPQGMDLVAVDLYSDLGNLVNMVLRDPDDYHLMEHAVAIKEKWGLP